MESIKTKDFNQILNNLNMDNQKVTMVIGEENKNLLLSSRNLNKVNLVLAMFGHELVPLKKVTK